MNEDEHTIESGMLDVGDGHKIYYQQWGNPDKPPIFFLHGGPGSGVKDKYKTNYNPEKQHLVFHSQRGSGDSTPFASIKNNTTQDLVEDIEKLRKHLRMDSIQLTGGSWGSFLSLAYAIKHHDKVDKILIGGIFTGTKNELDYIRQGGLKTHYPDAWSQYIELVPEAHRDSTSRYYLNMMQNGSDEERKEHVRRWVLLESSVMSIDSDFQKDKLSSYEYDATVETLAILEAHYFVNNCFVTDSYIYENAKKLKDIPIVMVHGRFDHICPPQSAFKLSELLGESCKLHIVPASHGNEAAYREVMRAYNWSFLG